MDTLKTNPTWKRSLYGKLCNVFWEYTPLFLIPKKCHLRKMLDNFWTAGRISNFKKFKFNFLVKKTGLCQLKPGEHQESQKSVFPVMHSPVLFFMPNERFKAFTYFYIFFAILFLIQPHLGRKWPKEGKNIKFLFFHSR